MKPLVGVEISVYRNVSNPNRIIQERYITVTSPLQCNASPLQCNILTVTFVTRVKRLEYREREYSIAPLGALPQTEGRAA